MNPPIYSANNRLIVPCGYLARDIINLSLLYKIQ